MLREFRILAILLVFAVALVTGCGGGGAADKGPSDDVTKIEYRVRGLQEAAISTNVELHKAEFAGGAAPPPAEMAKYAKLSFSPQKPEISGDTATVKVDAVDANNKPVGTYTWTAVKEGEQWKLKTAPLK